MSDIQLATADGQTTGLQLQNPQTIAPDAMASQVLNIFAQEEDIPALPVIDAQQRAIGLVTRRKVLNVFAHAFSRELNRNKTVDIVMESEPLIFDVSTPIEHVSQSVTQRDANHAFDPIIFTQDGIYVGLLSVVTLLKAMTDIHVQNAIDCNPLSRLPGNNRINREIDRRLDAKLPFVLVYADLDSFKAYNDCYGYERGDRIIQWVAGLLKASAQTGDFIGHVGGDDFVMLISPETWQQQLDDLLHKFATEVTQHYHEQDAQRGFILSQNRKGQDEKFALMSLSLAVILCPADSYPSHVCVAEVASEIKHLAKQQSGNSIVVNRRQTSQTA